MKARRTAILLAVLMTITATVSAADDDMANRVCSFITPVWKALTAIGATLVSIMVIYAGVRYVFAADDAGGRKAAKNLFIHAAIGGILLGLVGGIMTVLNLGAMCP